MYLSTYFLLFTKRQISKIVIVEICLICNLHRDGGLGPEEKNVRLGFLRAGSVEPGWQITGTPARARENRYSIYLIIFTIFTFALQKYLGISWKETFWNHLSNKTWFILLVPLQSDCKNIHEDFRFNPFFWKNYILLMSDFLFEKNVFHCGK